MVGWRGKLRNRSEIWKQRKRKVGNETEKKKAESIDYPKPIQIEFKIQKKKRDGGMILRTKAESNFGNTWSP